MEPPRAEDRRSLHHTLWDDQGYLHNHRPDGRYWAACIGCAQRKTEETCTYPHMHMHHTEPIPAP